MNKLDSKEAAEYASFYETRQGKAIAAAEASLLDSWLPCCSNVLSIGCGPAVVEQELLKNRPDLKITGVDGSAAMLHHAPIDIPVVQARAELLPFDDASFDAVLFITSLEFIEDYKKALAEARRVLRVYGRLIVLMLNPASSYFKERYNREDSYVCRYLRHVEHDDITTEITRRFTILQDSYRLGISQDRVFESTDPEIACLHLLEAAKYE